ncbi:MAG: hypothetical protein ABSB71_10740 [Candidatus Bathyarchaeia archaeon]
MVKLQFRIIRKRYKNGVYQYEQVSLNFPKELHEFLRCLRNRQLEIKASREGKTTHVTLIDSIYRTKQF